MNKPEAEQFEEDLQKLKPAAVPEDFMSRLMAAQPRLCEEPEPLAEVRAQRKSWFLLFRWLTPAAAVAAVAVTWLVSRPDGARTKPQVPATMATSTQHALKADQVEINRQLLAAYDAVAQLPDGTPVRFRCREWSDDVVLRDANHGMVIEKRTPRIEIIPVRYETY